jgi:hypothetical protein
MLGKMGLRGFMNKNLTVATVLVLVVIGFGACGKQLDVNQVITQESFNAESDRCLRDTSTPVELVGCIRKAFDPKVKKYCSDNNLTSDECLSVEKEVNLRMATYNREKSNEMQKTLDERKAH